MRHMSVKTVPDFVPTVAGGEEMKQKIKFGIVLINKNQSCQELIIFGDPPSLFSSTSFFKPLKD